MSQKSAMDVIKMREMRGEVENKTSKKEMDNPYFLLRHMADFFRHLVPPTLKFHVD